MFFSFRNKLFNFYKNGHERTLLIKKNIFVSFFLKGGSVIITFLLVPLTINYVNPIQYGIWLTISSMVYWINVFDIGIGNGLKNEIAKSIALKDESNLKKYISTSYAVLTMISILIFGIFLILDYFFDWNSVLNISDKIKYDIRPVIITVIGFFCIQFIVQVLDAVLSATQQVFKSSLILFLGQLLGLIIIYLCTLFAPGSLLLLVIVMAGSSVLVLIIASLYLYNTELRKFAPSFAAIDLTVIKKLLNIGGVFFIIQIAAMILIFANNFIITRILGPEAVTVYNIPFRLFSIISMLFGIIMMPYWSAFTDAYASNDINWIKINMQKIRLMWLGLSISGIIILIFSSQVYSIWIKDAVMVPFSLSLSMLIYVMVLTWHSIYTYFLNGIGKIRLQLFVVVIGASFNLPLAIYLGKIYGLVGIVSANSLTFTIMGLIYTIQYKKVISGKALNIWNK